MLEIVNLVLMEGEISCGYAFLGICVAIIRGKDLIVGVEPHIIIYFTEIKYFFFNLDHLKQALELVVRALKIVKLDVREQAPGCIN